MIGKEVREIVDLALGRLKELQVGFDEDIASIRKGSRRSRALTRQIKLTRRELGILNQSLPFEQRLHIVLRYFRGHNDDLHATMTSSSVIQAPHL